MRRGRRSDTSLTVGDTVDFWRVEALEANRLPLVAEMKLPGRAWLEFEVAGDGSSATIRQTATFDPVGLLGRAYWYALYPLHHLVSAQCCGESHVRRCATGQTSMTLIMPCNGMQPTPRDARG